MIFVAIDKERDAAAAAWLVSSAAALSRRRCDTVSTRRDTISVTLTYVFIQRASQCSIASAEIARFSGTHFNKVKGYLWPREDVGLNSTPWHDHMAPSLSGTPSSQRYQALGVYIVLKL